MICFFCKTKCKEQTHTLNQKHQVKPLVILEERKTFSFVTCIKRCSIYANFVMIHRLRIPFIPLSGSQPPGQVLLATTFSELGVLTQDRKVAAPQQLQHSSRVCLFSENLSYSIYCQVCDLDKTEQEDNICWSCGCQREIK